MVGDGKDMRCVERGNNSIFVILLSCRSKYHFMGHSVYIMLAGKQKQESSLRRNKKDLAVQLSQNP